MLARLIGLYLCVVNDLLGGLDAADGAVAGQYAHPVGGHNEQEDGQHERQEATRPLRSRDRLAQGYEELHEHLDQVLESGGHLAHLAGGEKGDDHEHNNREPRGDHGVGEMEAGEELVGEHRLRR